MSESPFTIEQMKAAKAVLRLFETGSLEGKYDLLVVLSDGAGITYGVTQTTENSGGLWRLLFENYTRLKGAFASDFEPYRERLYKRGDSSDKKFALTSDADFKALLVRAAREDELMRKAQDQYFHIDYFRPALQLAADYEVTQPLILTAFYDLCVHSGPKSAARHISKFNDSWEEPDSIGDDDFLEAERAWGEGLIKYRDNWLRTFKGRSRGHTRLVRKTVYRTETLLDLVRQGQWLLTLPVEVHMLGKTHTITSEVLKNVG